MAQLVEQLLPTPEIYGSTTVIGNFYFLSIVCIVMTKIKKNEAGNDPIKSPF